MKNAGRAGIVPKDDFDINIKYKRLDAVMYDKSLYIAKKDVPLGTLPTDTTYWMKSIYGNKEPIATTATVGVVKPDGDTITVDEDGTLHGQSKVDEMTGATADADGTSGTVPVPKAGQEDLFLSGDGTWREAGTNITVDSELSKESANPIENRAVAEELEKKINSDGDSKDLTTTFTSNDSTNVTEWTDVGLLTSGEKHSSLFQKVATMFKNIRYLYHMLGTADISTLGEGANIGTVTGAISKLNSDLTVEQYRLYDFIDGISEWSGQLNLCRKLNIIKGNYYIFLESYSGNLDGVFIAKHNMNLQNNIGIIVELTNGQGGTNNCTYGYGQLSFHTDGEVILTTNVKRDEISGFLYILVP